MNAGTPLNVGDVVQVDPECKNRAFAGCIMVVDKLVSDGARLFMQLLGETRDQMGGTTYVMMKFEDMEYVGKAVWIAK